MQGDVLWAGATREWLGESESLSSTKTHTVFSLVAAVCERAIFRIERAVVCSNRRAQCTGQVEWMAERRKEMKRHSEPHKQSNGVWRRGFGRDGERQETVSPHHRTGTWQHRRPCSFFLTGTKENVSSSSDPSQRRNLTWGRLHLRRMASKNGVKRPQQYNNC